MRRAPTLGAHDERERYVEGMERLVDAVPRLASTRTVDQIVDIVRSVARDLTGADGATFVLRDNDKCYYVDEDAIGPLWKGQRFPIETCISGWAMLNRQVVTIEDITVDPRIPLDAYRPTFVKSLAMVPIRTDDPLGAIGNYWARHYQPTATEIRLLQALADTTAVALENVRIVEGLEEIVGRRTDELSSAYADLQHFAAAVAHDLRSPLQTAAGFLELIADRHGVTLDDQAREWIRAARHSVSDMGRLVDDLLMYSRAGAMAVNPVPIDTTALVTRLVDRLRGRAEANGAHVEIGDLPEVVSDVSLLSVMLQNLIDNALAYGSPDGEPVAVDGASVDGGWELLVSDRGPGIDPSERSQVFEAFRRGTAGAGKPGFGMGLAIVARAAGRLGGDVAVVDDGQPGTRIRVFLPAPG
ncbi:MAG TPA: HAMP domain-containing sensor histidine kinase [Acidimicrobiia bacterium]|nr:HAMP domain-containing sensor histidine kinase [Acidimicrobiia bacterium]